MIKYIGSIFTNIIVNMYQKHGRMNMYCSEVCHAVNLMLLNHAVYLLRYVINYDHMHLSKFIYLHNQI